MFIFINTMSAPANGYKNGPRPGESDAAYKLRYALIKQDQRDRANGDAYLSNKQKTINRMLYKSRHAALSRKSVLRLKAMKPIVPLRKAAYKGNTMLSYAQRENRRYNHLLSNASRIIQHKFRQFRGRRTGREMLQDKLKAAMTNEGRVNSLYDAEIHNNPLHYMNSDHYNLKDPMPARDIQYGNQWVNKRAKDKMDKFRSDIGNLAADSRFVISPEHKKFPYPHSHHYKATAFKDRTQMSYAEQNHRMARAQQRLGKPSWNSEYQKWINHYANMDPLFWSPTASQKMREYAYYDAHPSASPSNMTYSQLGRSAYHSTPSSQIHVGGTVEPSIPSTTGGVPNAPNVVVNDLMVDAFGGRDHTGNAQFGEIGRVTRKTARGARSLFDEMEDEYDSRPLKRAKYADGTVITNDSSANYNSAGVRLDNNGWTYDK